MLKPTLYLMLGYPGAGKTTTAKIIHELTGAVHLWADKARREQFGTPKYTHEENLKLYKHLNEVTAALLKAGNSVIFDTNFNFYKDRDYLRQVAKEPGANTIVVWVKTPRDISKKRAVDGHEATHTRVLGNMPEEDFERMSSNLQPPKKDEQVIEVDGLRVTKDYIKSLLGL